MKIVCLIGYYLLVNLTTMTFYQSDKTKARRHQFRIPEKTLFRFAFWGGAVGAIMGMCCFHHKTRKSYFWVMNILALILHVALIYFLIFYLKII